MNYLYLLSLFFLLSACTSGTPLQKQEGKSFSVPANASREDVIKLATEVRPSYRQLDYQQREMLGFIHIGMNTFTGAEWGTGKEDPSIFNPDQLDAEEWVKTFKDAGITGVILVTKHHDGFCVWPSKYTDHTVAHSPWRNGQGDMVKEVADACKKYDLKLCLYLSPWDMHEETYGTEAYNDYYIHQLEELLTNYGPVYLLWFDGAGVNSKTSGKEMNFAWERIFKRARELQPDVLLSGAAPDIRWVGNEAGQGRETEWSVQGIDDENVLFGGEIKGHASTAKNLGSIDELMNKKRLVWYPSRGGLPLRKGWFYNPNDDQTTKSLEYLVNSYFSTVGQNSNLLPNLSPDKTGRIPGKDAKRLIDFGKIIAAMKQTDYALGAKTIPVSGWDNSSEKNVLTDNDPFTSWQTPDGVTQAEVRIELKAAAPINVIKLQENIRDYGQRVESFAIDALIEGEWKEVATSTTIGFRKMIRLKEPVETDQFRIRIQNSRVSVSLSNISMYYLAPIPKETERKNDRKALTDDNWIISSSGIYVQDTPLQYLVDNNESDCFKGIIRKLPAKFLFNFNNQEYILKGFSYLPDKTEHAGHIEEYALYFSNDGQNWGNPVIQGRFGNIVNNPVEQFIPFDGHKTKFVKMEILKATSDTISIPGLVFYQ